MLPDPLPCLTPRLRLRRFDPADLPAFQAYRGDPAVVRFQGWTTQTEEEAAAWILHMQTVPFCQPGVWFQLAVAEPDSNLLIGEIGLCRHARRPQHAELSFTLAPAWQGRGLAIEAARAAVALLWAHTTVQRLLALADVRNHASTRLLQRLGMAVLGPSQLEFRGEHCIQMLHALDRPQRSPNA